MTTKKKDAPKKEEITAKKIGNKLIAMIDGTKYVKIISDERQEASITNKIKLYNKRKTKKGKDDLLDIFNPKRAEVAKTDAKVKGLKKAIKKEGKEAIKGKAKAKAIKVSKTKTILTKVKNFVSFTLGQGNMKLEKDYSNLLVTTKNGGIALKGFEAFEMPDLLVKRIEEYLDASKNIQSLLNFWCLCLLNPNEIARTKLFDYLSRQRLLITPSGYFVTYRMVKTTDEKGVFTDNHTKKMRYKVGTVCAIPREECDEDGSTDCSKGLHTGTPLFIGIDTKKEVKKGKPMDEGVGVGEGYGFKYVTTKAENPNSYGTGYDAPAKDTTQTFDNAFGNQAIICLINPAHVVSVPDSDTRKMRSCEFYFAKLTTAQEVIDLELEDYYDIDLDYQKFELKQLQTMLKGKKLKEFVELKTDTTKKAELLKAQLEVTLASLKLSTDAINKDLTPEALKSIIKQRQIIINGK